MRKPRKRPVVQLTSLLDLLFVMIFVSLLQTKTPSAKAEAKKTPPPKPKVVEPKVVEKKPEPKPQPRIKNITAVFKFYSTPQSPGIPTGSYAMSGVFDRKTGSLRLGGTAWIDKPHPDMYMVPLSGQIDENGVFSGRVEDPDCKRFTLSPINSVAGSDLAGQWKGTYECAQGETGLTLTIE